MKVAKYLKLLTITFMSFALFTVNVEAGTLMKYDTYTSVFFGGNIARENVESIVFKNTLTAPNDAIGSWDASKEKDNSIIAWYCDSDNDRLYEIYVGASGYVNAPENSSQLFYGFENVNTIDLLYLNTSNVTNMSMMFQGMSSLTSLDLSNFDTSNVRDMFQMFVGMSSLTSLDVSHFDTSNVVNMRSMFLELESLTSLDISNFNTSNVIEMRGMFGGMYSLTSLDLSSFNTSNVTNMSLMFAAMNSLTTLDVSNFDTSKVTEMTGMFGEGIDEVPEGIIAEMISLKKLIINNSNIIYHLAGLISNKELIISPNIDSTNINGILNKNKETKTGLIATGDYIGSNKVIVMGDTSGDGKINFLDYVYIYNHIKKLKHPESINKNLLEDEYLIAADMNGDGNISYLDYVKIYKKIKELKGEN